MIKLLVSVAGENFSYQPGDKVSFDPETDARYVDSGQAEYIEDEVKRGDKASNTAKRAARKPVGG